MTKELIERYLQFAIENWYDKFKAPYNSMIDMINFDLKWNHCFPNITEIITSWPFIEAIARGLCKDMSISDAIQFFYWKTYLDDNLKEIPHKYSNRTRKETEEMFLKITWKKMSKMELSDRDVILKAIREWLLHIEEITHNQAIAIRDNKLDEFIQDLLPKN
jgi:hypothetical protein